MRLRTIEGWLPFELDAERFSVEPTSEGSDLPHLVPGLVDSHCHGVAGYDVMLGQAEQIAQELQALGIEWYLPTTVTASWSDIRKAMDAVTNFEGIAGFHLEGPFISAKAVGAQPHEHILPPSFETLERELGERLSRIRIVTLAPEVPGGCELTARLSAKDIIVSIGHSCATFDEMVEAARAGANRMTHFYNAMSPLHHRELGCVGYGLLNRPFCELIYDRVHVSRKAAELLIRSIGVEKLMAISDGTKASGKNSDEEIEMWGHQVRISKGAARLMDGTLCGSCSTLADVFCNLWSDFGPDVATDACSVNPRRQLGLPKPRLWLLVAEDGAILELLSGNLLYQV